MYYVYTLFHHNKETESQTLLHYPKEVTMPSELEEYDGAGTSKGKYVHIYMLFHSH